MKLKKPLENFGTECSICMHACMKKVRIDISKKLKKKFVEDEGVKSN